MSQVEWRTDQRERVTQNGKQIKNESHIMAKRSTIMNHIIWRTDRPK